MTKEAIVPIVNLNGTSKEELIKQCSDAYEALENAKRYLNHMAPHGRDYPGDFPRYSAAHQQWLNMDGKLNEVAIMIYEIWEGIDQQQNNRYEQGKNS